MSLENLQGQRGEELTLDPDAVIKKIRDVAGEIDPKLEIVVCEDVLFRGSGTSRVILVTLDDVVVSTFDVCVEKSRTGEVKVGRADFTLEEIRTKIESSLKKNH